MKNVHRYCLNTHTSPKCYSVLSHPLLVKEIPLLTYVQCVVILPALPLETACESRTCVGRLTNSWKPHMLWWVLVGRRRMDEVQLEGKCPKSDWLTNCSTFTRSGCSTISRERAGGMPVQRKQQLQLFISVPFSLFFPAFFTFFSCNRYNHMRISLKA